MCFCGSAFLGKLKRKMGGRGPRNTRPPIRGKERTEQETLGRRRAQSEVSPLHRRGALLHRGTDPLVPVRGAFRSSEMNYIANENRLQEWKRKISRERQKLVRERMHAEKLFPDDKLLPPVSERLMSCMFARTTRNRNVLRNLMFCTAGAFVVHRRIFRRPRKGVFTCAYVECNSFLFT